MSLSCTGEVMLGRFNDLLHDLQFPADTDFEPENGHVCITFADPERVYDNTPDVFFRVCVEEVEEVKIEGRLAGCPGGVIFQRFEFLQPNLLVMHNAQPVTVTFRVQSLRLTMVHLPPL